MLQTAGVHQFSRTWCVHIWCGHAADQTRPD